MFGGHSNTSIKPWERNKESDMIDVIYQRPIENR